MEEKRDLTLEFIRYSHSEQDLAQYCKQNNLDYLEFVDVVNQWNDRYGAPRPVTPDFICVYIPHIVGFQRRII